MKLRNAPFLIVLAFLAACNNESQNQSHGPIKLGDSSTIVTETDPRYLKDYVPDLRTPAEDKPEADEQPTTAAAPVTDTTTTTTATQPTPAATPGNGMNAAFKEVTLSIPNIAVRTYGKADLTNARGASFELTSGTIAGNTLQTSGGAVQKVTQRYQTILALKNGDKTLPLESLGNFSSPWTPVVAKGNTFPIVGLEPSKLTFKDLKPAAIRNAVQQAARRKRLNRDATKGWMDLSKNIQSATTAPCVITLRSISWRIEGKDAQGKTFNKELRIDIPL